ncbi:hypothetical protein [Enterococcus gallinarum]|uniref:hypothetical protein n=1 Tax=Enterococcus gallinarum TaxID=1353 RepID=UPI001AD730FC|nr:hypothetical protein [Enterococcus gallinarum]MBO6419918.1 hypothetical protein [Enterococcus gallinarum]MBO6423562.1 hypothetical protein [Enterococcus gallinarum]
MNKIYWLRRVGILLFMFGIGVFTTGQAPTWIKIGFPSVVMLWLMIYDEAMFEWEMRRREKRHAIRRKSSSVPMQELQPNEMV